MVLLYKTEKLKTLLTCKASVDKKFDTNIFGQIERFNTSVEGTETLKELKVLRPSLQIHPKDGTENTFIAYLNKQWRLEFTYDKGVASVVTISKVHPHKYTK